MYMARLLLLFGTELRLAEAAALDVHNVPTTDRTAAGARARRQRGARAHRAAAARPQLRSWLKQREQHPAARAGEPALTPTATLGPRPRPHAGRA